MSDEQYPISEEIVEMFDRSIVATECRDSCIKRFFGWKRAAHYGLEATKWKRKAWNAIYEVYPELRSKTISHRQGESFVRVTEGHKRDG